MMYGNLSSALIIVCLLLVCAAVLVVLAMGWKLVSKRQKPARWQIILTCLGLLGYADLAEFLPGLHQLYDLEHTENWFGQAMILPAVQQESRWSGNDLTGNFTLFRLYHLSPEQMRQIEAGIASHPGFPNDDYGSGTNWQKVAWLKMQQAADAKAVQPRIATVQGWLHHTFELEQAINARLKARQRVYFAGSFKGESDADLLVVFPDSLELIQIAIDT